MTIHNERDNNHNSFRSRLILHTDGGSRDRGKRYAAAAIVLTDGVKVVEERSWFLGEMTNNQAEYNGLIRGMEIARELGCKDLVCISDSQLMIRQLNNEYRVKKQHLKELYLQAKKLETNFSEVIYAHVTREHPMIQRADELLNTILDKHCGPSGFRKA